MDALIRPDAFIVQVRAAAPSGYLMNAVWIAWDENFDRLI